MAFTFDVDDSRVVAKLDRITSAIRPALKSAIEDEQRRVESQARSLAAAHIHTFGKKPGQYLASITGGIAESDTRIVGYVRSGDPVAHLLEYGATLPPHEIFAKEDGGVLAFSGADGGTVFAKKVNFPGADVPPYPALHPALEQNADEIRSTIIGAVKDAAR